MTREENLKRKATGYGLAIRDTMIMHGAKRQPAETISKVIQIAYLAGAAEADANPINLLNARKEMLDEVCEWIGRQKELLEDSFSDPNDFADILKQEMQKKYENNSYNR